MEQATIDANKFFKNGLGNVNKFTLIAEQELRFVASDENPVTLKLLSGNCEQNGVEWFPNKSYSFNYGSHSVYTWTGCVLNVDNNKTNKCYTAQDPRMLMALNISGAFDQIREDARISAENGPRILVVGANDTGKSALCTLLCNYAVRSHWTPLFVDLDSSLNTISFPGTISAAVVNKTIHYNEGFNTLVPIVHHYGYRNPADAQDLYFNSIVNLSKHVKLLLEKQPQVNQSGLIIDSPGFISDIGASNIVKIIKEFEVNMCLVMEDEKLTTEINTDLDLENIRIVTMPKCTGVVVRNKMERLDIEARIIREYYYSSNESLQPCSFELSFDSFDIIKFLPPIASADLRPADEEVSETIDYLIVKPDDNILNYVLSISQANKIENVTTDNVLGQSINEESRKITVLSPVHKPTNNRFFILMNKIQYLDSLIM